MYVIHESLNRRPKCRVELHVHLDGAIRPETIWEIMKKKGLELPDDGSLKSLTESFKVKEPHDIHLFLRAFHLYLPAFKGDLEAIERFSFEFVEDQSEQDVLYCEARFCPHLLLPDSTSEHEVSVRDILDASLRGLNRGRKKFGTKVCLILCLIWGQNDFSADILKLCEEYKGKGVVGIDIAGSVDCATNESEITNVLEIFTEAKSKEIHRTVHAGEESGWQSIKKALETLGAERIGHGYRVVENEEFYAECLKNKVHFEMCPYSSYLTGAIKQIELASKRHPIIRLAEDKASFSISSDDPTITGTHLNEEYQLLRQWGFNEALITRSNFEAAYNCFLPIDEKRELLKSLEEAYGVISHEKLEKPKRRISPAQNGHIPTIKIATWDERSP